MKPGIYKDLPNDQYHADRTHISSTVLKTAIKDPLLYYKQYVLGEKIPIKFQSALDLGSLIHAMVLEPHTVATDFAMWDGSRKAGKEFELFKMKHDGKIILNKGQQDMADMMFDDFNKTKIDLDNGETIMARDLFDGGECELSVFGKLGHLPIKTRYDYIDVDRGVIIDVKTTSQDVSTKKGAKEVIEGLGYDLSAALYLDMAEKQWGRKFVFQWCFMQKLNAHTKFYQASKETLEKGRKEYKAAIKQIKDWKKTGKYLTNKIEVI